MKKGTIFRHGRTLDPAWLPGPGEKYADGPKALCRVTAVRQGVVYYGIGSDSTRGDFFSTEADLLAGGAQVERKARRNTDNCKCCKSDSLFSGWFDADDLGYPHNIDSGDPPEGVRWTTFCNDCGEEQ